MTFWSACASVVLVFMTAQNYFGFRIREKSSQDYVLIVGMQFVLGWRGVRRRVRWWCKYPSISDHDSVGAIYYAFSENRFIGLSGAEMLLNLATQNNFLIPSGDILKILVIIRLWCPWFANVDKYHIIKWIPISYNLFVNLWPLALNFSDDSNAPIFNLALWALRNYIASP